MSEFGLKCWFVALSASIISSLYQLKQIQARSVVAEKDNVEQKKKLLK